MLVGIRILIIIAIMGGLIAYMGDKLGTKVGKRRMSLFGLRPKHTSIIVTIVTGLLVAAATVGVLTITSDSVRTALFGMDKLKAEMADLSSAVEAKNKELQEQQAKLNKSRAELASRTSELETVKSKVQATQAEVEEARAARDSMGEELVSIQQAYSEVNNQLADLEVTKMNMESHIASLQVTQKQLESGITQLREGTILFRVNELLAQAVVRPGLSAADSQATITNILNDTNGLILRRLGLDESKSVVFVSRTNIQEATDALANAQVPMAVQVIAAGNVIVGEPAVAEIHVYPQNLIYKQGDIIDSTVIAAGGNAQFSLINFLREVNSKAKSEGIIPDSLSGDVGNLPADELFTAIKRIDSMSGNVKVDAVVSADTYSSGPVPIHLRITQVD